MQVAVLCGGLATRLGPLSRSTPKSMLAINGRPFMEHQFKLLSGNGIRDIVLCVGHFHEQIMDYFGDGSRFGVNIKYSVDGDTLLGTGGALRRAYPLLDDEFSVMYGDSYLMLPYENIWRAYRESGKPGLMVVYRNDNRYDRSNLIVRDRRVVLYDPKHERDDLVFIDEGLTVLKKSVLQSIPENTPFGLGSLFSEMARRGDLASFETSQRFYEIGSVNGLEELKTVLR